MCINWNCNFANYLYRQIFNFNENRKQLWYLLYLVLLLHTITPRKTRWEIPQRDKHKSLNYSQTSNSSLSQKILKINQKNKNIDYLHIFSKHEYYLNRNHTAPKVEKSYAEISQYSIICSTYWTLYRAKVSPSIQPPHKYQLCQTVPKTSNWLVVFIRIKACPSNTHARKRRGSARRETNRYRTGMITISVVNTLFLVAAALNRAHYTMQRYL